MLSPSAVFQHIIHVSPAGEITDGKSDPCGDPPSFTPAFSRVAPRSRRRVIDFYHDVTLVHRNAVAAIRRNRDVDLAANRRGNTVGSDAARDARVERITKDSDAALQQSRTSYEKMRAAFIASLPPSDQEDARWVLADWIFTCPAKPGRRR
jgi:hypothetical protein